jgi:hypothetical protein
MVAVNQVSLFFYPHRWQQRLTPHATALTDQDQHLQIADAVPVANVEGPAVSVTAVKAWLVENGFVPAEWGVSCILQRGQVQSIFGREKEIEVCVADEAGEFTDLYIRFTLTRHTLPPLYEWAIFVVELCRRFHLRLGTEGVPRCSEAEFLSAVRADRFYREFAASYGWEVG